MTDPIYKTDALIAEDIEAYLDSDIDYPADMAEVFWRADVAAEPSAKRRLLFEAPSACDQGLRARERRAYRRAECLTEAHVHCIERRRVVSLRNIRRRRRVP